VAKEKKAEKDAEEKGLEEERTGGEAVKKRGRKNGGHDDAKMLIRAMQSGENSGVGK
jgi:hypothetical protein